MWFLSTTTRLKAVSALSVWILALSPVRRTRDCYWFRLRDGSVHGGWVERSGFEMSKTVEEIGLIVGGIGLALVSGPLGIIALQGSIAAFHIMLGIGLTTAMAGVGLALRPALKSVTTNGTVSFQNGVSPRRVGYGHVQTAGVLTYATFPAGQNQNTNSEFLHLVYTLFGHQITSFDGVVIDGVMYNFGTDIYANAGLPST